MRQSKTVLNRLETPLTQFAWQSSLHLALLNTKQSPSLPSSSFPFLFLWFQDANFPKAECYKLHENSEISREINILFSMFSM